MEKETEMEGGREERKKEAEKEGIERHTQTQRETERASGQIQRILELGISYLTTHTKPHIGGSWVAQ